MNRFRGVRRHFLRRRREGVLPHRDTTFLAASERLRLLMRIEKNQMERDGHRSLSQRFTPLHRVHWL